MRHVKPLSALLACAAIAATSLAQTTPPAPTPGPLIDLDHMDLTVKPILPTIPNRTFNITDFGGIGDGKTFNTDAFAKAIAAIDKAGGGHLIVPKGIYLTRPITLCSSLDLHLDEGAIIQAPATFTDYGLVEPATLTSPEDMAARFQRSPLLHQWQNLHDLDITGTGTIDGNGSIWWAWSERAAGRGFNQPGARIVLNRPKLFVIEGCQRMHVDGVTFSNSPKFHFVPENTSDLLVEHVKVKAPRNAPNTDAFDPLMCTNVLIRECEFDVGDDDIAIKTGGSKILIEDCRMAGGHGISIGSGTTGGIDGMLARHCTFDQSDNGIRIKSMRGAGGHVQNVRFTDIQMKDVGNAIILDFTYVDSNRPNFVGDPAKIPSMNHVLIDNVQITNARNAGKLIGLTESLISDITFRNIQMTANTDFTIRDAVELHWIDCEKTITPAPAGARGARGGAGRGTRGPTTAPAAAP